MEKVSKKRAEINQFKGQYRGLSKSDLNRELLIVLNNFMGSIPTVNTVTNPKCCALRELIRESRD